MNIVETVLKHERYYMNQKAKATSSKQIIKLIGSDKLELIKGDGYWYFIYDDFILNNRFDTHSVYVMYLNSMPVEDWVYVGKEFVRGMESTS